MALIDGWYAPHIQLLERYRGGDLNSPSPLPVYEQMNVSYFGNCSEPRRVQFASMMSRGSRMHGPPREGWISAAVFPLIF